jgi:hypothetical protein
MVAEKWARRAGSAQQEYTDGVGSTTRSWQAAASAAENSYKAGVAEAANRGAYGAGVKRAGDDRWKRNSLDKGGQRYAPGVQGATGDFQARVSPYLDVIGRTDLPARGPAGSPGNLQRVAALATALRAAKTGRR